MEPPTSSPSPGAARAGYRLEDRYVAERGRVVLTGIQALARLPFEQLRADRRAGLTTASFLSGYPGSPLGGFDLELGRALRLVSDLPVVHRPGLNEEYAATAVMGSQLAASRPDARYDGVVGFWYGKAPGVDRAADALRHAVYVGTTRTSGAVAFVGDDPAAKSSTVPSSSAGLLADLHIPFLYPADPGEVLDLGRHAVALSRSTGLWAALKIVADVADATATVDLDPDRVVPFLVGDRRALRVPLPEANLLTPLTLEMERDIFEVRYALATEYAATNDLNTVTVDAPGAWIGLLSSGITYREVREALSRLGLRSDADVARAGIRLYRMSMPMPFDPAGVRAFAEGLEEVFVIEEKQPNLESLVKDALYGTAGAPRIVGKHDEQGRVLVPGYGSLDADHVVRALRARLAPRLAERLAPEPPAREPALRIAAQRTPFYCSGCPHNRSTEVPPGALVAAGIGCSTMAILMDPKRVGAISGVTCMGNEGTQWIGMAPFVEAPHLFQNLGDGTYFHSGQLAVTAAVAAGVNITYKLLYNGVIAMTGGQRSPGHLGVSEIAANLLNQGVARVLVTTDDPSRYRDVLLPPKVEVWGRERLLEAQRLLGETPGVTVLIHDQACAAEARRLRRRGKIPTPPRRVVINHRVCEGCGDCGRVSNCLSLQPVDTPFGRKTQVDPTTCNLDYSCLEGDCPSFAVVDLRPRFFERRYWQARRGRARGMPSRAGARAIAPAVADVASEPLPAPVPIVRSEALNVRLTGIGGTGVVTVSQVVATAAMLAGYHVRGLDQIGLSQKAGPVVSDLCLRRAEPAYSSRVGARQADVLVALDGLVAASDKGLSVIARDRTVVVGSTSCEPTGAMVGDPLAAMPSPGDIARAIAAEAGSAPAFWADAERRTTAAFGEAQTANVFVVGMAVQAGALPIAVEFVEEALRLNGVAVEENLAAFRLGRACVASGAASADAGSEVGAEVGSDAGGNADARAPHATASAPASTGDAALDAALAALALAPALASDVARFAADLVAYQGRALARGYLATLAEVAAAERRIGREPERLTHAVARNLHKLVAYKDEYEVARLLTTDDGARAVRERARALGGRAKLLLHPPLLRALGLRHKLAIPGWATPALRLLAKGRRLRGTPLDPFGWARVRREERALPAEYRAALATALRALDPARYDDAVALAELPDLVRGYEDLKLRRIAELRERLPEAVARASR
ncbi:MAG: indolepyruvate ferredoxin oxidoreductase family protein [Myxococcota bacterium]|nr:indolepyruvate ferredoxin oxidoreductase family protein [Myxococcales bacterium]